MNSPDEPPDDVGRPPDDANGANNPDPDAGETPLDKTPRRAPPPPTTDLGSTIELDELEDDMPDLDNPRYGLCQELQRGGMGIIFVADDRQLPREVAVKVLRKEFRDAPQAIRRFANEARVMGFLSHPGVPPIYECGVCADGRPYHVMKLILGATLADMLHFGHPSSSELLSIFADICQTMAFAHSRGLMHLDLKPGNVMVGAFGEVHVTDWGLARFEDQSQESFRNWFDGKAIRKTDSEVQGTLQYMSPEQARGDLLDTRADVFGLGAILCEILTGQAPYRGDNLQQIYSHAIRGSMGDTLEGLEESDTDRALVRLAKRCLSRKPRDRPESAEEVAKELMSYQATALQRIESDMNRFFDLSLDLFCIADFQGFFRRINSNFSRVLGFTNEELMAQPFIHFVHPDDRHRTVTQMSVLGKGQPVVRFRNRYRTADGKYIVLEWTSKAIQDESLIFAVARDVTASI
ncbi:protein kinase domain-containing protein [Roseimaritima ulvae]|uniref:Serine/threonine-protein kinase PknB n=1 Tax=Roseimaritima ulvae TaxID=980254 RepID=A0A5B9QP50_9BACT|nr:protein kinase [Roseimaritima ulvae]QEG39729.1 Serine/threonine-protein kinase PknB [Roseimaritima ulvae]